MKNTSKVTKLLFKSMLPYNSKAFLGYRGANFVSMFQNPRFFMSSEYIF